MSDQQEQNGHEVEEQQFSQEPQEGKHVRDDVEQIKNIVREILSEREGVAESVAPG